jgi:hypothetical protein
MAIPIYDQFTTAEQNLIDLLVVQAGVNPPIGREDFAVLAVKAILNLYAPASGSITLDLANSLYLKIALNLSDVPNKLQALANLGGVSVGDANASFLKIANNLSDVPNKPQALINLGAMAAGTGLTVTEGNNSYAQLVNNLSDLPDKPTALANLGGLSVVAASSTYVALVDYYADIAAINAAIAGLSGSGLTQATADGRYLQITNNLSDVNNATLALANLGGLNASQNLNDLPDKVVAIGNLGAVPMTTLYSGMNSAFNGILVKAPDGSGIVRELVASGSGVSVANGLGAAGNPEISLSARLQQIVDAVFAEGGLLTYEGGDLKTVGRMVENFGGVPRVIVESQSYTVKSGTQALYSLPIELEGTLVLEGELVSV